MTRSRIASRDALTIALVVLLGFAATGTHTVTRGETLGAIAARYDVTLAELISLNGLANPNLIRVGQQLRLPVEDRTHVVGSGENLASIAARYGVSVSSMVSANSISNPNYIRAGQTLTIPGDGAGAAASSSAPADSSSSGASSGRGLPGQTHTVRPGQTLRGIAALHGLAASDIAAWNGIVDGRLYAGARLKLYDHGSLPAVGSGGGGGSHTVGRGQTLGGIAARYGVSVSALAQANGISDPNRIRAGQQLTIPGGSGGTSSAIRCPVPGATFMNDWGFPRSGGRAHAGNDLFAPRGTPVLAPVDGTVAFATGSRGGKQFRLVGRDGTVWFGSHMDRFGTDGDVSAGTVVGYVGDSGNARGTPPHLHFEVHPSGEAVNPYPLLRSVC